MIRYFIFSLLFILMAGEHSYAEVVDKIVAVVNDEIITRKDLEDFKKEFARRE